MPKNTTQEPLNLTDLIRNGPIQPNQRQRIFASIRTLTKQIYGKTNKHLEQCVRNMIMLTAIDHGYPYRYEYSAIEFKSLSIATFMEANIVNLAINHFADSFYPENGIPLYLYKKDDEGKFKSIGDRTREEMIKDFPEVYCEE